MTLTVLPVVHQGDDFDLDPAVVEALWRMEERHFWAAARTAWIAAALAEAGLGPGARVLDVGCGSGRVAGDLAGRGYDVTGVDTAEPLVREADRRHPEVRFFVADVAGLPADVTGFDAIGLFDVLEHVDAPEALVRAAARRARPGGVVLATVPARRALRTVIDDASGHKRRYERCELAALLTRSGLADVCERGIFRWTEPLQRLARRRYRRVDAASRDQARRALVNSLRVPVPPLNALLGAVCAAERRLGFARSIDRPGPTLLGAGRVPPGA